MIDLASIRTFPQLVRYLRDELDWPISTDSFEDLTFEYTPQELGIDGKSAAKIQEIKRMRALSVNQPWGIFFVKFEPKQLPIVALRRILSSVALKGRASANNSERRAWDAEDLLFISNYGEPEDGRRITFAHFSQDPIKRGLPTLRVLGWDSLDTLLHIDDVARALHEYLRWPHNEADIDLWRAEWRGAFTLRYQEVITTSRALAVRLAALARAIRSRINAALAIETSHGPLTAVMNGFRAALVHDLDADGFADMYAQTIAYGLLSARIASPTTTDGFAASIPVSNPFLRDLMDALLEVGGSREESATGATLNFDELGVGEVVDLLDHANMEAVVRDFGDRNPQEDPVIHFYELFLKEYDPREKVKRGVFYTPRPAVSYIVRAVHELLQRDFGLPDGLADTATWADVIARDGVLAIPEGVSPEQPFVQILDPATGTGTFLVEVVDVIHRTMLAKWKEQGRDRLTIEELWNDYVRRYLLPRLNGYELLMAPYAIAHLKIGLKLHETGYRFGPDERVRIYLTNSLEAPGDFSGQLQLAIPALAKEAKAVNEAKRGQRFTVVLGNPPYSGHSANTGAWIARLVHDYHFVDGKPLGERNPKWLQDDYVKFVRLGEQLLSEASAGILGYITNHSYSDNPTFRGMRRSLMNAFASLWLLDLHGNSKRREKAPDMQRDENVFDIQQGVAILLAVRPVASKTTSKVAYGSLWGTRDQKYSRLTSGTLRDTEFEELAPSSPFYLFVPQDTRLRVEYDPLPSIPEVFPLNSMGITTGDDDRFVAFASSDFEKPLLGDPSKIVDLSYRPFDTRRIYYDPDRLARGRFDFMRHMLGGDNLALITIRRPRNDLTSNVFVSNRLTDKCFISSLDNCQVFPLNVEPDEGGLGLTALRSPNIGAGFVERLSAALGLERSRSTGLPDGVTPRGCLNYAYAVFHSPGYRNRYSAFLKVDFPRVPLPATLALFHDLTRLGGRLVALHLMERPNPDTSLTTYIGPHHPEVRRVGWSDETVWLDAHATKGEKLVTPGTVGFRGVPDDVWSFRVGAYQVCEKWLKDRKGRVLTASDISHYQRIVAALRETIRIMGSIDEVIETHGGWPHAFSG